MNIFHWVNDVVARSSNIVSGPVPNGTWPKPLPAWSPFCVWSAVVDGTDKGLPDTPLNRFLQDKVFATAFYFVCLFDVHDTVCMF